MPDMVFKRQMHMRVAVAGRFAFLIHLHHFNDTLIDSEPCLHGETHPRMGVGPEDIREQDLRAWLLMDNSRTRKDTSYHFLL